MKKKPNNRAFTLIELLVVIAIIGILSSVVLASLNSARDSATEAGILASLKSINNQAQIYRNANDTYEGLCDDSKISEMVDALDDSSEGAACWVSTDKYTDSDYQIEIAPIDYGVGATANEIYYGADPTGAYTFDTATGGRTNWVNAKTACSNAGKRLPGPSVLKAIYDIGSTTPSGFNESYFWSYLESPSDSFDAYRTDLVNGTVASHDKDIGRYTHCVH